MKFSENFKMAIHSLLAHKMRSILTMLGIVIGIASVITVVAIGKGGENVLKSQITGEGNTIDIYYELKNDEALTEQLDVTENESPFSNEDIKVLEDIEGVESVIASSSEYSSVRSQKENMSMSVNGINSKYFDVHKIEVVEGRQFYSSDYISGNRGVLITEEVENKLFEDRSAVGESVFIQGQPLKVLGIYKKEGGMLSLSESEVSMPMATWNTLFKSNNITEVSLKVENVNDLQTIGQKATETLNDIHNTHKTDYAFTVYNMEELADGVGQITTIMTTVVSSIAGVALVVGGVGVMNIMLVSVTERTKEIGIRLALGATRQQILSQFLVESITLTLIGGGIGVSVGWLLSILVSTIVNWPILISWYVVLGALIFSMIIGLIFGILPANKAARLDPIDSLRYE